MTDSLVTGARKIRYTHILYAMTMGTNINATTVITDSVKWLEDELVMVILYLGSRLDGIRFGKSPVTPVKTTDKMAPQDDRKALNMAPFVENNFMPKRRSAIVNKL